MMTRFTNTFAWARLALLTILLSAGMTRLAEAQDARDLMREAQAAYDDIDYETAQAKAQAALEAGGNSTQRLTRIYRLIGICAAATDNTDDARQAFIRLLAIDPEASLEQDLSPRLRTPFLEARGYWANRDERLGTRIRLRNSRLHIGLSDGLDIVDRVVVHTRVPGDDEFTRHRLDPEEHQELRLGSRDAPAHGVEYYLELRDEFGNALVEDGHVDEPLSLGDMSDPNEVITLPGNPVEDDGFVGSTGFWLILTGLIVGGAIATAVILTNPSMELQPGVVKPGIAFRPIAAE